MIFFQVVIPVGAVLISGRAEVRVSGSLLNLPFALINLSLQFQLGSRLLPQSRSEIVARCGSALLKDGHA